MDKDAKKTKKDRKKETGFLIRKCNWPCAIITYTRLKILTAGKRERKKEKKIEKKKENKTLLLQLVKVKRLIGQSGWLNVI